MGASEMDGSGKFIVVDKGSPIEPMPYAGFWRKDNSKKLLSLGLSASDYAWQVLYIALSQTFSPDNLDINKLISIKSDPELKKYLTSSGVVVEGSWQPINPV